MQSIEVTAKSVEDAKRSAAEKLGVAPDALQVTVLEESKGLFGKSSVRVRAEVVEAAPAKPARAATKAPARAAKAASVDEPAAAPAPAPAPAKAEEPKGVLGRSRARKPAAAEPAPIADIQTAMNEVNEEPAKAPRRGRAAKAEPAPAAEPAADADGQESEVAATDADAERFATLLRELLAPSNLSVDVRAAGAQGRYVSLVIDGKDAAFLVGKHGEVLNQLQYLLNIIASRRFGSGVRATLDGNDYRKRREDTLTQLAVNIANQVKKRGEEAVLDALPAFERRIVHKALSTIDGITTYSEGEEPNRRVVIAPGE